MILKQTFTMFQFPTGIRVISTHRNSEEGVREEQVSIPYGNQSYFYLNKYCGYTVVYPPNKFQFPTGIRVISTRYGDYLQVDRK